MKILQYEAPAADIASFDGEFAFFMHCRKSIRQLMPTPDQFPLFCELVDAAKKIYASTPQSVRSATKYISFENHGRIWSIRMNGNLKAPPEAAFIDICGNESNATLVTVLAKVDSISQENRGGDPDPHPESATIRD